MGGLAILRSISLLVVSLLALPAVLQAASAEKIVVLRERDRLEMTPLVRGEAELIPVAVLLNGLGVVQALDPKGNALHLRYDTRQVTLYQDKSLASVGGDLRLLSANVVVDGSRWFVPVDSVARFLGPLLKQRVEYRAGQRVLIVGNVSVPRVTFATSVSGDGVKVTLEASETVPFRVQQEGSVVTVSVARDVIDVPGQGAERLTGGIVDRVQFTGGRENVFTITLGRRFQTLQQQEQGPKLVLDFLPTPQAATGPSPAGPASPPAPTAPSQPGAVGQRTIVIDAGHGGAEVGAKGPGGSLEKDVTLAIARKLRSALTNTLGVQAFLTRDKDQEVGLDDRAALANNFKADLFISVHANASRSQGARGSEVYFLSYQTSDDESRRIATLEGGSNLEVPGGGVASSSDLNLILWDMAQAEHLEESSALASRVQEELATVTGSDSRGVKQAPFRVLVGAAMPAILVEVAFISNSEEEKLLTSEAYQNRIAAALVKGIARYQADRAQPSGTLSRVGGGPIH
jgi:N-acetylmuramoyl-L-alanine amidase